MQITLEGITGSGEIWLDIMKIICGDTSTKSMIDLGCHRAPYTPLLGFKYRKYIDIQERPLDHADEQKYFIKSDILDYMNSLSTENYTIIASDVIEHLTKKDGEDLFKLMWVKSHLFIIFTPLGSYMVNGDDNHDPDAHRSGWLPKDFLGCSSIILPDFHPELGIGAFFSFHNYFIGEDKRILNEIKIKYDKNRTDRKCY